MLNSNMFSLEKICLNLIAKQFERFYFAFTVSKDGILQKDFEFLQRRFSVELLTELFESKNLEDKFFEFLINEHVKFFDGLWLMKSRYLKAVENIFRRLPNLRKIRFNECGDEVLENIAKFCPKIVEIEAIYSNVTDAGVKYLCENESGMLPCPELRRLTLMPSCITDKGVECLIRSLPLLERIDYPSIPLLLYHIHEENVSKMKKVHYYNLKELVILQFDHPAGYMKILETCLTVCPKLESLECYISNRQQLNFFTNSSLKKVRLRFVTDLKVNVLDDFLKMNGSNLTSIGLSYCVICVPSLAEHCPVLKEFLASNVEFTDDNECQLTFPSLTECIFEMLDSSSAKAVCLLISSSPKLESISFANVELSLEMKTQILSWCKNPFAKKIQFTSFRVDTEFVRFLRDVLLNCPSLEVMRLARCFIYDPSGTKALLSVARSLSNKPKIDILNFLIYE